MNSGPNPNKPMTPRKAREIMNLDKTEKQFADFDIMKIRTAQIIDAGLKFHETLWNAKGKQREKLRADMDKYPREFHAKERSFALFFNKFVPTKIETKDTTPGKGITADALEKMNLTLEEIKKIAFGAKEEEATIVESGNADAEKESV